MARKSRYTPEIADKIVEFISCGYTLRDTAYAVGVSDETIRRWRERHMDFNKRVIEASNHQWDHPEDLIKYNHPSYRSYRRPKIAPSPDYDQNTVKHPSDEEKPLLEPLKPARQQFMYGIPVRPNTPTELVRTPKYFNASTGTIEWIAPYVGNGKLVVHRCSVEAHLRNLEAERLRRSTPFIFDVA